MTRVNVTVTTVRTPLTLTLCTLLTAALLGACGGEADDYANPTQADCDRTGVSADQCALRLTTETTTCEFAPFKYTVRRQGWTKHIECSAAAGYLPQTAGMQVDHYSRKIVSAQSETVSLNMIDDASEWMTGQCDMQLPVATRESLSQKVEDRITVAAKMTAVAINGTMTVVAARGIGFSSNYPRVTPSFVFANCTHTTDTL